MLPARSVKPRTLLLISAFIVLAGLLAFATLHYFRNYKQGIIRQVENELAAVAELKISELTRWRQERFSDASVYYRNDNFSSLVSRYIEEENGESEERLRIWLRQIREAYDYDRICLHDTSGRELIAWPTGTVPIPHAFHQDLQKALVSGSIMWEDFYMNEYDGNIYLSVLTPVIQEGPDSTVIGVLGFRIDPETYLYPMINRWPVPSRTEETLIVRREGDEVVFLNSLRFNPDAALNLRVPVSEMSLPAVQAVTGHMGITRGTNYRGTRVFSCVAHVPGSEWYLVANVDEEEALEPLAEVRRNLAMMVFSLLVLTGGLMGMIWRQQYIASIKEKAETAEKLRKLNRVYAVLSDINQAIIRFRDKEALYREVCRIATGKGEFLLAWLGKYDPGTEQVDMVAFDTQAEMDAEGVIPDMHDSSESARPVFRCIQTGERIIVNDIMAEPALAPWHDQSRQAGFRSMAVFPLKVGEELWGIFTLYASAPHFFDEEEIRLLDELAMDISFSIEYMELEEKERETREELKKIEWLLQPGDFRDHIHAPVYGDITRLNRGGLILEAVGKEALNGIIGEFMDLLGTSSAVYEKNGDYAAGIFSSGWCRFMDRCSFELCGTDNLAEALQSGRWHCHESCWKDAAVKSMETNGPVDIECAGGIHLYAVPIRAGEEIIGSINFGYGNPPRDRETLNELAEKYGTSPEILQEKAEEYESRPPFIVELAKFRLEGAARLIALMVERHRTRQELENARYLMDYIIRHDPDAIAVFDRDMKYIFVSERYVQHFGLEETELMGKVYDEVLPDTSDEMKKVYRDALKGKITRKEEDEFVREDGEKIVTRWECRPWHNADGSVDGVILYIEEITEEKKAEMELRESESRYRSLVEYAPDAIFINLFDKVIMANKACLEMFGAENPEELVGKSIYEIFHPDSHDLVRERIRVLHETGEAVPPVEEKMVRLDGQVVEVETVAAPFSYGGVNAIHVILHDLTRRKLDQKKLEERNAFIQSILDNLPIGVAVNETQTGKATYMNRMFGQIYGWPNKELTSVERFFELVYPDPEYRGMIMKKVMEDIRSGDPSRMHWEEIRATTAEGEKKYVNAVNIPVPGQAVMVSTVQDVTEIVEARMRLEDINRELEERVTERTAQLQATNKELEAFAYSVSHDLRAPLRAIDGFARIIEEEYAPQLDREGRRLFGVVRESAETMDKLISDLLELSRTGRTSVKPEKVNMAEVVRSVFLEIVPEDTRKLFRMQIGKMPDARVDPSLIKHVWTNLLSNAVKYSMPSKTKKIEVGGTRKENKLIYFVRDHGVGFNPEYAHKLFGVFQRLHRSEEFEGTGVGLAIVQRIVHRHGGEVWAEGEEGKGATFWLSLPLPGVETKKEHG
ncbi:MAG TPA: PAS domain S-box protein [Bacteroidetes bacterium]|nr:PAS domain S-box protein [Bacteroidota bacterium]